MRTTVTVFGAGIMDRTCKEYLDTVRIGEIIGSKGYNLKNGGYSGVMEASAKGFQGSPGISIGYPCATYKSTKGNKYNHMSIICVNVFDRLSKLMDSDIFK